MHSVLGAVLTCALTAGVTGAPPVEPKALAGRTVWSYNARGAMSGPPTIALVKPGGKPTAFALTRDGRLFALDARTGAELWSTQTALVAGYPSPVTGELLPGGVTAVVVRSGSKISTFNAATGTLVWSVQPGVGDEWSTWPVVHDIDRDGRPEVVILSWNWRTKLGHLSVLDGATGKTLRQFESRSGAQTEPAVADVNGDGQVEIVYGDAGSHRVLALDAGTGKELWAVPGHEMIFSLASGALLETTERQVIVASGKGLVTLAGRTGATVWTAPESVFAMPAMVDLDGDRRLEVLVFVLGHVVALAGDTGRAKWDYDLQATPLGLAPLPVADVDGDGVPEVLATRYFSRGKRGATLHVLDGRSGNPRLVFEVGTSPLPLPAAADVDGDGRAEVFVVLGGGSLTCIKIEAH